MLFKDNGCSFDRERKLFKMLLEAIPSSVLFINREGRITLANRNFLEKSRRSLANTIGYRLEEVFPAVILKHTDMEKRIQQVFYKKEPCRGQQMTYRAPGVTIRSYYYSIFPCVWQGMVENVMLLMEDVTERIRLSEEVRRIERHLASVVESATDLVLSTDIDGRILTWNTAAEKLSGYTLQKMKGCHFSNLFRPRHQKEFNKVFAKTKCENKSQTIECDLITLQDTPIPVSWVLSPMKDDYSQTIAIVVVGRDLTERRKLEEQLLQSQKLAALGVMAGGIAHEIRNPLAVCYSAAQFLMDDDITPDFRKECADKIQTGIHKASLIIENLLKFSRPSVNTEMTLLDLVSAIKETLALITNQAKLQKKNRNH
jgi:PAS domain S-box-containing protein